MKKILFPLIGLACVGAFNLHADDSTPPVRIALAGLSHDHARGFVPRLAKRTDVQLVGIVETNSDLIARYSSQYHLPPGIFYSSLEDLFAHTNVQGVATFTDIYSHQRVVEFCAAHGADVMVEKPLATNMKQARAIAAAAKKSGIQVIVNYETTWYAGNHAAYAMIHDEHQIGDIRKIVVHDGHRGPKEIGCSTNFLAWLTDPVLNGGGVINDFGCYGADLATWFFDGQKPTSVFATALHIKPDLYPKVEDDATIVLTYPKAQVILQPSWNWPLDRKDMEIYGQSGQVIIPQPTTLLVRTWKSPKEAQVTAPALTGANGDPVSYFAAVVRKEIVPSGLSSLDVNVTVVEILDSAHKSVKTGKEVKL